MLIASRQLSAGGRQTNPTSLANAFGKTNVLCGSGRVDTRVCVLCSHRIKSFWQTQ